jgi:hypothetical protein
MTKLGIVGALVAGLIVVLPAPASATTAACTWQTVALPEPAGANVFSIRLGGTDHSGGWAGRASVSGAGSRVFSWKNGTVTDHGPIPSPSGTAWVTDENRAGTIVTTMTDGAWGQIAVGFRIRGGQWDQLVPIQGGTRSEAVAINDSGDILGMNWVVRNGTAGPVVVRWPAGQTAAVEVPGIPFDSRAIDLDEDGTMLVGVRDPASGAYLPNVVRGGVRTALPGGQQPEATAISNGRVTGAIYANSHYTAVVWERDLTRRSLPGAGQALLINRDGLVIARPTSIPPSHGVWRGGTLEFSFGTTDDIVDTGAINDDGTFAGTLGYIPTVWRCA